MIKVVNEGVKFIYGYWEIEEEEWFIKFIFKIEWEKGNYIIIIDSCLEDIVGNNF